MCVCVCVCFISQVLFYCLTNTTLLFIGSLSILLHVSVMRYTRSIKTCLLDSKMTLDCQISSSAATIQNVIFHLTWYQDLCIPEFSCTSCPLYSIMQGLHRDRDNFTVYVCACAHTHTELRGAIHHCIKSGSHCIYVYMHHNSVCATELHHLLYDDCLFLYGK